MKRKLLCVLLFLIAAFVSMTSAFVCNNYEWFYTRLYMGNRVEGTYCVTVEGKNVEIEDFEYTLNNDNIQHKFDSKKFSTKIGEYGIHHIRFVISNKNLYDITNDECFNNNEKTVVGVDYFNTNNWHIFKLDINLNITKASEGWVVETSVKDDSYPFDDEWYIWDTSCVPLGEFLQLGP